MRFIQILEFTTSRIDEIQALMDTWVAQSRGTPQGRALGPHH